MKIEAKVIDYLNEQQAHELSYLLNNYAQDPMGGGAALSDYTQQNLAKELAKVPHAFSVICYVDGKPAGLVNCFEAFSTFKCQPLVNIHDLVVVSEFRGLGISQLMLDKVEEQAQAKGCRKITLEVLSGNEIAQQSYLKFGFDGYELSPEMGKALFWQKML